MVSILYFCKVHWSGTVLVFSKSYVLAPQKKPSEKDYLIHIFKTVVNIQRVSTNRNTLTLSLISVKVSREYKTFDNDDGNKAKVYWSSDVAHVQACRSSR